MRLMDWIDSDWINFVNVDGSAVDAILARRKALQKEDDSDSEEEDEEEWS